MTAMRDFLKDVDETLCDYSLCQHPLCWDTLRRLERGLPRKRVGSVPKIPPEYQDELPPLNILELPQWSADNKVGPLDIPITSRKTSAILDPHEAARPGSPQTVSMEGCKVPGSLDFLQFARNCKASCSRIRGAPATHNKLAVTEMKQYHSSCDQYPGNTTFIWIPNPSYDRKQQKKRIESITTAQHVTVQEISFQGQSYKQQKRSRKKKKAKDSVPTGGQPYTFLARQQQILRGLKETMKDKEHELVDLKQSDGQDSGRISAYLALAPISQKFALRNHTEKQQLNLSNTRFKMDGKCLKGKKMNLVQLETIKQQKYLGKRSSASGQIFTGSKCQPSPASCIEGEWIGHFNEIYGRDLQMTSAQSSNLCDNVQHPDITPNGKLETKDIVDNRTDTENDAERGFTPHVLVKPGDEMQIIKRIEEQDLSTAPEIRSPSVEQSHSGISLLVDERNEQQFTSTSIEMHSRSVEQIHSDEQISPQVTERSEQEEHSTTTEVTSPSVEQMRSDEQISLQVTERSEQEEHSTTTEITSPSVEQMRSDEQISLQVTERSEQEEHSTTTEITSPSVEQMRSDEQISLQVTERSEQEEHSTTTEITSPSVEQMRSDEQISLQVTERSEQEEHSTTTEITSPSVEQMRSDEQISLQVTERSEQEEHSTTTEVTSPSVEQMRSDEQISLQVTERSEQGEQSTTPEIMSPNVEQIHSDERISPQVAERSEQEERSTTTEVTSPNMEQIRSDEQITPQVAESEQEERSISTPDMGQTHSLINSPVSEKSEQVLLSIHTPDMGQVPSKNSLTVFGESKQEFFSSSTEIKPSSMEQMHSEISPPAVERSELEFFSTSTGNSALIIEQRASKKSDDHQNSIAIAKGVEEQDQVANYKRAPSFIGETDQVGAED